MGEGDAVAYLRFALYSSSSVQSRTSLKACSSEGGGENSKTSFSLNDGGVAAMMLRHVSSRPHGSTRDSYGQKRRMRLVGTGAGSVACHLTDVTVGQSGS